ncbi:MAG: encapsulin [Acidobacteriota bacterium]
MTLHAMTSPDSAGDALPWTPEERRHVADAVAHETRRVEIAPKFLPGFDVDRDTLTVTTDTVVDGDGAPFETIDEAAVVPLVEIWSDFAMTPQQVKDEGSLHAARTLAIRATNFLTRGQDALIFRGQDATGDDPLFTEGKVRFRSGPAGSGLLGGLTEEQEVRVTATAAPHRFAERTLGAVTEACARLKGLGHYGPYALALHDTVYGDVFSPLEGTLIQTADRLRPMLHRGLYGTGTLPASGASTSGLLVSLGGNSMDLVLGRRAEAHYLFDDADGLFRFRVSKRFALRLKTPSAVMKLVFDSNPEDPKPADQETPE